MLLAAQDPPVNVFLVYTPLDGGLDFLQHFLAVTARFGNRFFQHLVTHRIEGRKPQLFQFHAQGIDTQAVGNRRVDVQCFPGNTAALVRAHDAQRAHVMQAIGQLHEDNADIAYHGKQHLAEILGLGFCLGFKFNLGQLADTVDQFCNLAAKFGSNLLLDHRCIFNYIMQNGGNNRFMIKAQISKNPGGGNGVIDIGFATQAMLAIMGLGSKQVGPVNLLYLFRLQVGFQQLEQITD
jgi:hypothetical protein